MQEPPQGDRERDQGCERHRPEVHGGEGAGEGKRDERPGRKGRREGDERETVDATFPHDESRFSPGDIPLHIRDLDAYDEDEPVEEERKGESKEGGVESPPRNEVARARHQETESDHVRDLSEAPVSERERGGGVGPAEEVAGDAEGEEDRGVVVDGHEGIPDQDRNRHQNDGCRERRRLEARVRGEDAAPPGDRRRLGEPVRVGIEIVVAVVDREVRRRHGRVAEEELRRGELRPEEEGEERSAGERDEAREEEGKSAKPDEFAEGAGVHGGVCRGSDMYRFPRYRPLRIALRAVDTALAGPRLPESGAVARRTGLCRDRELLLPFPPSRRVSTATGPAREKLHEAQNERGGEHDMQAEEERDEPELRLLRLVPEGMHRGDGPERPEKREEEEPFLGGPPRRPLRRPFITVVGKERNDVEEEVDRYRGHDGPHAA